MFVYKLIVLYKMVIVWFLIKIIDKRGFLIDFIICCMYGLDFLKLCIINIFVLMESV